MRQSEHEWKMARGQDRQEEKHARISISERESRSFSPCSWTLSWVGKTSFESILEQNREDSWHKKTTKRYIVSSRHSFTSQDYKNKLQVALSYCVQCLPLLLGLSLQVLSMSAKCPLKCNRNLLLRIEPSCMKSGLDIFMSILFMRGIREIRQSDP